MRKENEKKKWLTARMFLAIAVIALAVLGLGFAATGVDTDSSADLPAPTSGDYDFTAPTAADLVYSGIAKTFTVTPKTGAGAVTATHYYSDEACTATATPKDVGTYYIAVDVSAGTTYGAMNGLHDSAWKFTITPYGLDIGSLTATYTGSPNLKVNDFSTGIGSETVTIKCNAPKYDVGTYTFVTASPTSTQFSAEVEGNTNYVVSNGTKLTITPASFNGATFTLTSSSAPYTGSPISVSIGTVTLTGFSIVASDYDISTPTDMTSIGEKTIRLTGKGNFTGTTAASQKFTITGAAITAVSIKTGEKFEFNNTNIVPSFSQLVITSSGGTVTASDVTITASNNKDAGTATVTVTGSSTGITGSASCNFTIDPLAVTFTSASDSKTYDGSALTKNSVSFSRSLPVSQVFNCYCTGTITDVGSTSNVFTYEPVSGTDANNYSITPDYGTLTVNAADISGTLEQDGTLTYKGSAQTASVKGLTTVNSQPLTIKYNTDGSETYGDMPSFTNADSYTVYYKATAPNHNDKTGDFTVTIGKAAQSPSMSDVNFVYGTSESVSVTGLEETPDVTYSVNSGSSASVMKFTGVLQWVSAGSTIIKATYSETTNYQGGTVTCTVTTQKATPSVTAPAAVSGLKYTGSAQNLVTAGSTTGGTLQYKVGTGSYGTSIPQGTAAATYNVYYKVVGNDYYNDVAETGPIAVSIAKGTQNPTMDDVNFVYGTSQNVTAKGFKETVLISYYVKSGSSASVSSGGVLTWISAGSTVIEADYSSTANYEGGKISCTVTTEKATPVVSPVPTAITGLKYTGSAQNLINAGTTSGGTLQYKLYSDGEYGTSIPQGDIADTYDVYYKVVGNTYYKDVSESAAILVTISNADQDISYVTTVVNKTYGDAKFINPLTQTKVEGTISYTSSAPAVASVDASTGEVTILKSGSTTITAKAAATPNYNEKTASYTLNVDKATGSVTIIGDPSKTYDGTAVTDPSIESSSTGAPTYEYKVSGGTYSSDKPVNAGSYTVKVTLAADDKYTSASAEKNFTISKATQSPTMEDVTFTYGVPTSVVITGLKENPTKTYGLNNTTYATIDSSNGTLTWVSVGSVTATVTYSATDNYEAGSKTCTVTTQKATPTITIVKKTGLEYTGSPQELLTTGTTSGGTIYFRYDMQSKPSTPPYSTDYSTDIPKGTIAGTYILFVKVVGDDHYNDVSGSYHGYIDMAKGTITVITTEYNPTYTGTEQTPGKTDLAYTGFSARPDDAKVTIAAKSGFNCTDAGTQKVTVTVTGDDNFNNYTGDVTYTIGKKAPSASNFDYTAPSDLVYSGTAKSATVTVKSGVTGMGSFVVKYFTDSALTSEKSPIDVGTYYVGVIVSAGDNYSAANINIASFAITKATMNDVPAKTFTYSGKTEFTVTNFETGTNGEKVTLTYTSSSANVNTYIYGGSPSFTLAYSGTQNYNFGTIGNMTIEQKDLKISVDVDKAFDGTALTAGTSSFSTSDLVEGDSFTAGVLTTTGTTVKDYTVFTTEWTITTALATTKGIGNYNVIWNSVSMEITKKDITISVTASKTYDGTALSSTALTVNIDTPLAPGDSITAGEVTTTGSNAKVYTVQTTDWTVTTPVATSKGIDNYNVTWSVTLTINLQFLTITVDAEKIYNGDKLSDTYDHFVASGLKGGDTLTAGKVTTTGTDVKNYTVMGTDWEITTDLATANGIDNYSVSWSVSLEIKVKTLNITVDVEKSYDGSALKAGKTSFTTTDLVSGDSFTAGELTTTGKDSKDYTVQTTEWTITTALATTKSISNYNVVWTSVSMEIKKVELTPSVDFTNVTVKVYDGTTTVSGTPAIKLSGAVNGENPTATAASYVLTSKDVGTKSIKATGITLNSPWETNYYLSATEVTSSTTNSLVTIKTIDVSTKIMWTIPVPPAPTYNKTDQSNLISVSFAGAGSDGMIKLDLSFLGTSGAAKDQTKFIKAGMYTVTATMPSAYSGNYQLSGTCSDSCTMYQKDITAEQKPGTEISKVYDGTTTNTSTVTDYYIFKTLETGDVVTLNATLTFDYKDVLTADRVVVSGLSLGGADAGNYHLTTSSFYIEDAKITPRPLTLPNKYIEYDNSHKTLTFNFATGIGSETIDITYTANAVDAYAYEYSATDAPYKYTAEFADGTGGGLASNYKVADSGNGTFTIAVALIVETDMGYPTIDAAISAVQNNQTIRLINSYVGHTTVDLKNPLSTDKTFQIEVNGKPLDLSNVLTLTGTSSVSIDCTVSGSSVSGKIVLTDDTWVISTVDLSSSVVSGERATSVIGLDVAPTTVYGCFAKLDTAINVCNMDSFGTRNLTGATIDAVSDDSIVSPGHLAANRTLVIKGGTTVKLTREFTFYGKIDLKASAKFLSGMDAEDAPSTSTVSLTFETTSIIEMESTSVFQEHGALTLKGSSHGIHTKIMMFSYLIIDENADGAFDIIQGGSDPIDISGKIGKGASIDFAKFNVTGNVEINSTLEVRYRSTLSITGDVKISGSLSTSGTSSVTGDVEIPGSVTVMTNGVLTVSGNVELTGTIGVFIDGILSISRKLTIGEHGKVVSSAGSAYQSIRTMTMEIDLENINALDNAAGKVMLISYGDSVYKGPYQCLYHMTTVTQMYAFAVAEREEKFEAFKILILNVQPSESVNTMSGTNPDQFTVWQNHFIGLYDIDGIYTDMAETSTAQFDSAYGKDTVFKYRVSLGPDFIIDNGKTEEQLQFSVTPRIGLIDEDIHLNVTFSPTSTEIHDPLMIYYYDEGEGKWVWGKFPTDGIDIKKTDVSTIQFSIIFHKIGTYEVTATVTDKADPTKVYDVNTVSFVIDKGKAVYSTAPVAKDLTYDSTAQELITAGTTTNGTFMYRLGVDSFSDSIPKATDAGTYTIAYYIQGDSDHLDSDVEFLSATIAQANLGTNTTIIIAGTPFTYTGSEITVTPTVTGLGVQQSDWIIVSGDAGTNVGSYTLVIAATLTGNFYGTNSATWSIVKAAPSYDAPVAKDLTYNGLAQELITAGSAVGGTIQYKLGTGSYSSVIPTGINASTYTVYYKVIGDANHSDISETLISGVQIKAKNISASDFQSVSDYVFTGAEIKPVPTAIWPATSGDCTITYANNVNAGVATITLTGKSNYTGSATMYFNILKKDLTVSASASKTFDNAVLSKAVSATGLVSGDAVSGTVSTVSAHTGIYTVKDQDWTFTTALATTKGIQNYNVSYSVSLTINKAAISGVTVTVTGSPYAYTGSEIKVSYTVSGSNIADTDWYVVSGNAGTNVGSYTLVIGATDTGNFSGTKTAAWSITKSAPSYVAPVAKDLTYTGLAQELITAGSAVGGTIQYKLGTGSYTSVIPTAVNASTYTVYYKVIGDANHSDIPETLISGVQIKAKTLSAADFDSVADYVFTGAEIKPIPTAIWPATSGDYVTPITYANNVNVGVASITLTGKSNYTGSATLYFNILKKDLTVSASASKTFDNAVLSKAVSATGLVSGDAVSGTVSTISAHAGIYTVNDQDWTFTTALATTKGIQNYNVSYSVSLTINKAALSGVTITNTGGTYTYSGLEIEFKFSVTGANVQASDWYVVSGNSGINAGDYTLTIGATDSGNFSGTATKAWTIIKATPSYTVTPAGISGLVYDGTSQELITAGSATGGTIWYKVDSGNYSTSIPTGTNAGDYTVKYKVVGAPNYSDVAETALPAINIAKAASTAAAPTAKALVYNGAAQVLVNAGSTNTGTMKYKLSTASDYSTDIPKGTNAADYTVDYKVVGDSNHNDLTGSVAVTISKKDIALAVVTLTTLLTYNGSEQTQPVSSVTVDGLTVTYNVANNRGSNAGTYTMTITGTGNFCGTALKDFTIVKRSIAYASISLTNFTYDGTLKTTVATVTDGSPSKIVVNDWYIVSGNTGTDAGTYTMTIGSTVSGNYVGEKTQTWKIDKATPTYAVTPAGISGLVYDGTSQELITAGSATGGTIWYNVNGGNYSTSIPTGTNAGDYTVKYKIVGGANYNDVGEATLSAINIAKAASTSTAPTAKALVYNGSAQELINAGSTSTGTMKYKLSTASDYSTDLPKGTNAADYTVDYKVIGDSNHNDLTGSVAVTISKKDIALAVVTLGTALTYNNTVQIQSVSSVKVDGLTVTYTNSDFTGKNAGTYTMTITGNGNFCGTALKDFTIAKANLGTTTTVAVYPAIAGYTGSEIKATPTVTGLGIQASDYHIVSGNAGTNVGFYTLVVAATDAGNFYGTNSGTWQIAKAAPSYDAPAAKDLTYSGLAQELITAGSVVGGTIQYKLGTGSYSSVIPTGINASTYTVYYKVIGDANHSDISETQITGVQIKAKTISASDFESVSDYVYTGAAITPVPVSIWPMTENDRTVAYSNNVNAGVATITLTGKSNYTGSAVLTFNILKKSLENSMITINGSYTYNTNVQNVSFTVADTAPAVITASDWIIVSGGSGVDAGTYTLVITGTDSGNYTGTAQKDWTIGKATPIYSAPAAKSLTYNGTAQALVFAGITAGGEMLYALSLSDTFSTELPTAINAGDYMVYYMIDGGDNYVDVPATSAMKVDVKIVPKLFTSDMVSYVENYVYNGTVQTVQFEVSDGTALTSSDYSVSGTFEAKDVGSYDLKLDATSVGKNYKGTVQITWNITPKALDNLMISITGSYTFTGSPVTPTFTVYDGTGLVLGTDYTVIEDLNVNAGEHTLVISGLGNYQGEATKTWTLAPKDLSGAVVTVAPAQTYNGNVITQTVQSVAVSGIADGTVVTYYVVDNMAVDAGSHILKVVGYGNFTGEQTAEWKIDRATQTIVFGTTTVYKAVGCSPFVNPYTRTVFCHDAIQFSSGNKSIADVDQSGTVTVYAEGKVTISAYAPETQNYTSAKASYTVDVSSSKRVVTEPTIASKQYTGSLLKADVPASTLYTVTKNDGGINIGTYDVVLTLTDPESYKWSTVDTADVTLPFNIVKKEQKFRFTDANVSKIYGNADFTNPLVIDALYSTVTYSSDNEAVATVDQNGKVTIKGAGTATITASAPEGDIYAAGSASFTLNVDKATLTATYLGENIHCGDQFKGSVSVTGFVNGETAATAAGYTAPFVYNPHKTAGIYSLAPINGAADNYKFDYVYGTLLIEHCLSYHAEGTADPTYAHYRCDGCGRIFIDENASIEVIMNESYIEIIENVDQITVQDSEIIEVFGVIDTIKKDYPDMKFVVVFKSDSDGLILLKEQMETLVANGDIIAVGFGTFNTDVTFSVENLKKIGITGDYDFTAKRVQATGKYAERFKDASVYDLQLGVGSSTITEFGSNVRLRLSYTLSYGQTADNVACYYLGENAEKLGDAKYDELTESITFTTGHFSLYAVTYEAPAPNDNNYNWILIIALIIIVILALIIYGLYRVIKRRQNNGMQ